MPRFTGVGPRIKARLLGPGLSAAQRRARRRALLLRPSLRPRHLPRMVERPQHADEGPRAARAGLADDGEAISSSGSRPRAGRTALAGVRDAPAGRSRWAVARERAPSPAHPCTRYQAGRMASRSNALC